MESELWEVSAAPADGGDVWGKGQHRCNPISNGGGDLGEGGGHSEVRAQMQI